MTDIRIIKKYPNRRLYDTDTKSYITLQDVKQLVCDDINFKVIDASSENDITQMTLLQIILEQEAGNAPLFTTSLLRNFIRFYDKKSSHLFGQYLEQSMQAFNQQKDFFKDQWAAYQKFLNMNIPGKKSNKE
jgi:polyhydroxyalkanoate synthesis repressor PhaR